MGLITAQQPAGGRSQRNVTNSPWCPITPCLVLVSKGNRALGINNMFCEMFIIIVISVDGWYLARYCMYGGAVIEIPYLILFYCYQIVVTTLRVWMRPRWQGLANLMSPRYPASESEQLRILITIRRVSKRQKICYPQQFWFWPPSIGSSLARVWPGPVMTLK